MITVLITGCSKHSKSVIDCLRNNYNNEKVVVIGVDCNETALLKNGVDHAFVVPRITNPGYIPTLLNICKEYKVDVLFPYITSELEVISQYQYVKAFKEIGTHVSVSSYESIKRVNNKIRLYDEFGKYMPTQIVPKKATDVRQFVSHFGNGNVCCKISDGCGGTGFAIVDNEKAYDMTLFNKARTPRYITAEFLEDIINRDDRKYTVLLQELIRGTDYSTCALSDKGKVISMCGYAGYSMEFGAVVSGEILKNDMAYEIHKEIIEKTGLDGNTCADFIINGDKATLLEINPRLNASLPFVVEAGPNLIYDRCNMLLGRPVGECINIKYGLRMNKFYEAEYF